MHKLSAQNQRLWQDPRTGFWYAIVQQPGGRLQLHPISIPTEETAPAPPPAGESDPLAILLFGGAIALGIAALAWAIGYWSAPRQVQPPSAVVVCQTKREAHWLWSKEETVCK